MSLHRSLKTTAAALNQHRNVLTRAERISRLSERERFDADAHSPFGLVKVANRQVIKKKVKAEEKVEGADAVPEKPATPSK